jgi:GlpG protein
VVTCIGIFLGLTSQKNHQSWETLSKWGYLPAVSIWDGGYWALVSSVFVHFDLWHVAFNVYWLWVLASRLERAIGSLRFLGFFIGSAFISSSLQLAISDSTGYGASGVVYAIFGFMWPVRHRFPQFNEALDQRTVNIFVLWLVGCVVATLLKIWQVGNAAHISGLLFGAAVAGYFAVGYKPRLMLTGISALIVGAIAPLFWCPWSVTWLSNKAYRAHVTQRYDEAADFYTRIIQMDPNNAWAYHNRSAVYESLGNSEKARADLEKARKLDPSLEDRKDDGVAWFPRMSCDRHAQAEHDGSLHTNLGAYPLPVLDRPRHCRGYNSRGVHRAQ